MRAIEWVVTDPSRCCGRYAPIDHQGADPMKTFAALALVAAAAALPACSQKAQDESAEAANTVAADTSATMSNAAGDVEAASDEAFGDAERNLDNAGVVRRAPPVPPGIDITTHAGQSSKSPLLGTTIQANCHRCSSTVYYSPECAQVTCCDCSTVILSLECSACGSFFGARVGDAQSTCPYCKFSGATSDLMQRRVDSFLQVEGPRATLLHPHDIHIITQVRLRCLNACPALLHTIFL